MMMQDTHQSPELTPEQRNALLRVVHNAPRTLLPPRSDAPEELPSADGAAVNLSVIGQPLFVGSIIHNLDHKMRVAIPPKFAEELKKQGQPFLTLSPSRSLWLFGGQEFERIYSELHAAVALSDSAFALKDFFTNHSHQVSMDPTRRIFIPAVLRSCVFKTDEVPTKILLCGSGNFIELKPVYCSESESNSLKLVTK